MGVRTKLSKARTQGFTLIELLVAIAIIAILMGIGVPSYRYITYSSRIASEMNSLTGSLQFARAEAIKEGLSVTVCATTTTTSCSGASTWNTGWIVFADANGNATVDAGERILRIEGGFTGGDTFVASNSVAAITFNREGFVSGLPADPVTITLTPPNTTQTRWTRCLAVGKIGRMSVQTSGTGACL